jgi:hypothetical protein
MFVSFRQSLANGLKAGVLLAIFSSFGATLEYFGAGQVSLFASIVPIFAIYSLERNNRILLFKGMTFPTIVFLISIICVYVTFNYGGLVGLAAIPSVVFLTGSLIFMLFRTYTTPS